MSNKKIIDFNLQKNHNESLKHCFDNDTTKEILENGIHIAVAAIPRGDLDHINFKRDAVISGVTEEDEIFLELPDVNTFDKEEIFSFQEALLKSIELQYNRINGPGSYKKDYAKYVSSKFKGNGFVSPDPLEFVKLEQIVDEMTTVLSKEEADAREEVINSFPNTIKMTLYNQAYFDNVHTLLTSDDDSKESTESLAYLLNKEEKFTKLLDTKSDDPNLEFLSKVLKSKAINDGAVEKEIEDKYGNETIDTLIPIIVGTIGNDLEKFKQLKNLIENKFKIEFTLKELEETNTSGKFKEFNRLKDSSEKYLTYHQEMHKASEAYFLSEDKKGWEKDSEKNKANLEMLKERIESVNTKCLNHLINGDEYVTSNENVENIKKEILDKEIDPNMPEFLKNIISQAINKGASKASACDCALCKYENSIDTLVTL